jgi:predicted transport protein
MKQFGWDNIIYNPIRASNTSESIKTVTKFDTKELKEVNKEIRTYRPEDHFKEWWDTSRELYDELRDRILSLDSRLSERAVKSYIWFNIWSLNVVIVKINKGKIWLDLLRVQVKDLHDPSEKTKYWEKSMDYYNKHVTRYMIESSDDIDYGIMLVKQVLKKFF